jgi:hypothetical protein
MPGLGLGCSMSLDRLDPAWLLGPLGIKAYQQAKTKRADWEDRFRVEKERAIHANRTLGRADRKEKEWREGQAGCSTRMARLVWRTC